MAAPNTKDWRALENEHKPEGLHLLVSGLVEVSNLNKAPRLAKTDSRDPKVLGLDLTIVETDEPAGDAMVWKGANYHEEVTEDQYNGVAIRWEGEVIARTVVIDDRQRSALMDTQAKAQNTVAARVTKAKPPAKKPAAKKAAAKKAAPKKAAPKKSAPKKAKKKAAKKSVKKAAKKPAKSGLKKLVRKLVKKLSPAKKKKRR